jgi:hypothetical protein
MNQTDLTLLPAQALATALSSSPWWCATVPALAALLARAWRHAAHDSRLLQRAALWHFDSWFDSRLTVFIIIIIIIILRDSTYDVMNSSSVREEESVCDVRCGGDLISHPLRLHGPHLGSCCLRKQDPSWRRPAVSPEPMSPTGRRPAGSANP